MEPDYPWDAMHHRSLFLPKHMFISDKKKEQEIYAIESKDFLPSSKVDWFKNHIPVPDAFEEEKYVEYLTYHQCEHIQKS